MEINTCIRIVSFEKQFRRQIKPHYMLKILKKPLIWQSLLIITTYMCSINLIDVFYNNGVAFSSDGGNFSILSNILVWILVNLLFLVIRAFSSLDSNYEFKLNDKWLKCFWFINDFKLLYARIRFCFRLDLYFSFLGRFYDFVITASVNHFSSNKIVFKYRVCLFKHKFI